MNSVPTRIATNTRAVPRSGWIMTSTNAGAISRPAPTSVQTLPRLVLAPGQERGQHGDHRHLRDLRELEGDAAEGDPALGAVDRHADDQRHDQQADADQVDRPRERAQPAIVERGGDGEGDDRDREPHQAAGEGRSRIERAAGAVGPRHQQADDGQGDGEERQRHVERLPAAQFGRETAALPGARSTRIAVIGQCPP